MATWKCPACSYLFRDQERDSGDDAEPQRFEDHPANWICPECGTAKDKFEKIKIVED